MFLHLFLFMRSNKGNLRDNARIMATKSFRSLTPINDNEYYLNGEYQKALAIVADRPSAWESRVASYTDCRRYINKSIDVLRISDLINKRFYISSKKYHIVPCGNRYPYSGDYTESEYTLVDLDCFFRSLDEDSKQGKAYLLVDLVEHSTKEHYPLDVVELLTHFSHVLKAEDYDSRDLAKMDIWDLKKLPWTNTIKSDINTSFHNRIKDIKPYITNKELVDAFIKTVGNRQIYFEQTEYITQRLRGDFSRFYYPKVSVLNAFFVQGINF